MKNVSGTYMDFLVKKMKEIIEQKHEEDPKNYPTWEEYVENEVRRVLEKS